MALPPSSYHARALTFGCMAKGKGVSSRANLLISVKVLVGNTVSSGHHAKVVSSSQPLNKKKKKKKKQIKEQSKKNNKGKNGLGKNASMTGTTHLLQRHP
jgi:tetrahydromethanopterin S-methyltransferase subunit H